MDIGHADNLHPKKQRLLSLLPRIMPYSLARKLLLPTGPEAVTRDDYLKQMKLEVLWLNARHLVRNFEHHGTHLVDPKETYVITSLHFGQWGMYPASLYQQQGISSQMVATGLNLNEATPEGHFWYSYGHSRQTLSGHPVCYSTENPYRHIQRLSSGTNLIVIADVREQGRKQKEIALEFCGSPFYLPRTVHTLASRARVRILPYLGYYDTRCDKHRIIWYAPIPADASPAETLQRLLQLWEPIFCENRQNYFNLWDYQTRPMS